MNLLKPFLLLFLVSVLNLSAQPSGIGQRSLRQHTRIESRVWEPIQTNEKLIFEKVSEFKKSKRELKVKANGIPDHQVGRFPNAQNPNFIKVQNHEFSLPLNPRPLKEPIPLHNETVRGPPNIPFGIAVNGVLFDPGTAEFFMGNRRADWNYEALSGAVLLGLDENHGHVQPNGSYHYHGLPTGLLRNMSVNGKEHSPLVGYAMDGYPIYVIYGFEDPQCMESKIKKIKSSYRLKKGKRPDPPGGSYDGSFSKDFEFVDGSGDLDQCNGRVTKTKEYPEGIYAYFLTENWPVIPRYFRAEPIRLRGDRAARRGNLKEIPSRKPF